MSIAVLWVLREVEVIEFGVPTGIRIPVAAVKGMDACKFLYIDVYMDKNHAVLA